MRMWMVPPEIMCRKHLLGEHVECHMFVGAILKGNKLDGYVKKNLVEPLELRNRHDELVKEMIHRGYNHNSYLDLFIVKLQTYDPNIVYYKINKQQSLLDLLNRCPECKERYFDYLFV